MKDKDQISYYCFNKACKGSVYFYDTIKIQDLPFSARTLSREHHCIICNCKLISAIDIELKQAIAQNLPQPVLLG